MGENVAYFELGGGVSEGVQSIIQDGISGNISVWGGDVGPDPQDGAGAEYFSTQGCATIHQEAANEAVVWDMGLSFSESGNGRSGL